MNRDDMMRSARLAGQVLRYHTWPVHRRQSIGEHSWQVYRIYFALWGPPPQDTVSYIMWHDAGELTTGDLPFPFKHSHAHLKATLDAIEREAVLKVGGPPLPLLEDLEATRVKVAHMLEMWEFGLYELRMGNVFGQPVADDCHAMAVHLSFTLPSDERARVADFINNNPMRG